MATARRPKESLPEAFGTTAADATRTKGRGKRALRRIPVTGLLDNSTWSRHRSVRDETGDAYRSTHRASANCSPIDSASRAPLCPEHGKDDVVDPFALEPKALPKVVIPAHADRFEQTHRGGVARIHRSEYPVLTQGAVKISEGGVHRFGGVSTPLVFWGDGNADLRRGRGEFASASP